MYIVQIGIEPNAPLFIMYTDAGVGEGIIAKVGAVFPVPAHWHAENALWWICHERGIDCKTETPRYARPDRVMEIVEVPDWVGDETGKFPPPSELAQNVTAAADMG